MNTENRKAFYRELMTLAIPLALQNLLNALVGASDALMLGRLNQASIVTGDPWYMILSNLSAITCLKPLCEFAKWLL